MNALSQIDSWPVDNAAAAVLGPNGVIATKGDLDHRFPLASVTKMLSAYAALVAIEEGDLSLTDEAGPPGATIAHLLSHASGLGMDDALHPLSRPAVRRMYSNAGIDVLGEVVGIRTDMDFSEFAEEAVFEPLEMTATSLGEFPSRSGISTVGDMAKFCAELMSPTLIDASTNKLATSVRFPGLAGVLPGFGRFDPCDWGLGFEIKSQKSPHWTATRNSTATFGHFGQSGTFLWVDPSISLGLVVLTDQPFGDWSREAWPVFGDSVIDEFERGLK